MKKVLLFTMLASALITVNSCKKDKPTTGQVTFWYNSNGTEATVNINGQTGTVSQYYDTYNPTCGSVGCANFTLPTGTYTYHAESSFHVWDGSVSVTKDDCELVLLQ